MAHRGTQKNNDVMRMYKNSAVACTWYVGMQLPVT